MITRAAKAKRDALVAKGERVCRICKQGLSLERFVRVVRRDKRGRPGHEWEALSYDCRECRAALKRAARKHAGARSRAEWKAEIAAREAEKERRKADRAARRLDPEEARRREIRRRVDRQRERYNSDPEYHGTNQGQEDT